MMKAIPSGIAFFMRYLLIISFICLSCKTYSQNIPATLIGLWQGNLLWYKPGNKEPQKIKMQLSIQPIEKSGRYTWHITYDEKNENLRPYQLIPVDSVKGHWIVDEMNGIQLNQYVVANKFCSAFTTLNTTIIDCYWIEHKKLMVEFLSYDLNSGKVTGGGSADIPEVKSYVIKSYQKAVLRKVNKRHQLPLRKK